MSKPPPARYRTTNWSSYNASLRKRGALLIWVDKDMTWRAPRDGRPGRPAVFSDAAIQFCLSIKVLFRLPLRQTAGMVASLLVCQRGCHEYQDQHRCDSLKRLDEQVAEQHRRSRRSRPHECQHYADDDADGNSQHQVAAEKPLD